MKYAKHGNVKTPHAGERLGWDVGKMAPLKNIKERRKEKVMCATLRVLLMATFLMAASGVALADSFTFDMGDTLD